MANHCSSTANARLTANRTDTRHCGREDRLSGRIKSDADLTEGCYSRPKLWGRAVPLYRVYFRNQHAFIIGRDDFLAVDDADATVIAKTLADACSDLCTGIELRQGARRVDTSPEQLIPDADEIAARVQNIVLERLLVLRESQWVIAESGRLLKETQRLLERRPALK
jgi:hypothetical protein